MEGKGKVSHGVHRELGPGWGRGARCFPIERHNVGVQSGTKGTMGIRRTKLEEVGERPAHAGGCRIDLRGGVHKPKGGHAPLVRKQDRQGRQAGLGGEDLDARGQEAVRNPALYLSRVDLHLGEEAL